MVYGMIDRVAFLYAVYQCNTADRSWERRTQLWRKKQISGGFSYRWRFYWFPLLGLPHFPWSIWQKITTMITLFTSISISVRKCTESWSIWISVKMHWSKAWISVDWLFWWGIFYFSGLSAPKRSGKGEAASWSCCPYSFLCRQSSTVQGFKRRFISENSVFCRRRMLSEASITIFTVWQCAGISLYW